VRDVTPWGPLWGWRRVGTENSTCWRRRAAGEGERPEEERGRRRQGAGGGKGLKKGRGWEIILSSRTLLLLLLCQFQYLLGSVPSRFQGLRAVSIADFVVQARRDVIICVCIVKVVVIIKIQGPSSPFRPRLDEFCIAGQVCLVALIGEGFPISMWRVGRFTVILRWRAVVTIAASHLQSVFRGARRERWDGRMIVQPGERRAPLPSYLWMRSWWSSVLCARGPDSKNRALKRRHFWLSRRTSEHSGITCVERRVQIGRQNRPRTSPKTPANSQTDWLRTDAKIFFVLVVMNHVYDHC